MITVLPSCIIEPELQAGHDDLSDCPLEQFGKLLGWELCDGINVGEVIGT